MAKKQINYLDLSSKELEILKDTYIKCKVKSMNNNDLKNFAIENISLQIKNTIGDDEESEAWHEMEEFFKDEFENIIKDIQIETKSKNEDRYDLNLRGSNPSTNYKEEDQKLDMWED